MATVRLLFLLFFKAPELASAKFLMNISRSEILIKTAAKSPRLASTASDLTAKYHLTFYVLYTFVRIMLFWPRMRHPWTKKRKTLRIQLTNPGLSTIQTPNRSHTLLLLIFLHLGSFLLQNRNLFQLLAVCWFCWFLRDRKSVV